MLTSALVVQVRGYWTLWQRPGTSSSVMSSPCCRPSSTQSRYTIGRAGWFLFARLSVRVRRFVVIGTIVWFLFPDLY